MLKMCRTIIITPLKHRWITSTNALQKENMYAIIIKMLTKTKKQRVMKETGVHEKDTGSADVQISLLTKRIGELTSHLKKNPKDKHSRRGLLSMVANRQTHMRYLEKKSPRRFNSLMKKLELRK